MGLLVPFFCSDMGLMQLSPLLCFEAGVFLSTELRPLISFPWQKVFLSLPCFRGGSLIRFFLGRSSRSSTFFTRRSSRCHARFFFTPRRFVLRSSRTPLLLAPESGAFFFFLTLGSLFSRAGRRTGVLSSEDGLPVSTSFFWFSSGGRKHLS